MSCNGIKNKGFEVKAIDVSQTGVEIMSENGVDAQHINFFDYQGEKYDTLLLLMNGVGISGDLTGLKKLLSHAKELLNSGGQILIDSTDIIYMFMEEDGSVLLDMNDKYYGEMTYEMEYKGVIGKPFSWLYIDFENLEQYAKEAGFSAENISHDDYSYLARLTLNI